MRSPVSVILVVIGLFVLAQAALAQADDICREFGETPTREIDRVNRQAPYVYGRIVLKGIGPNEKMPRVTVVYSDQRQPALRQVITRSGNYCFRRQGNGGIILIDVEGIEVIRKNVSDIGEPRQREDFELLVPQIQQNAAPGVISTRFARTPNDKTTDLYKKAGEAESNKQSKQAIYLVKEIVSVDPEDFVAWAKLGSLYVAANQQKDAEAAFARSLELRSDYPTALINFGMLRAFQNQFETAVALFERAVASDPKSAIAHRLLGEAYLQIRKGTLGLAALDKALELDPLGQAECHLLKARLYDLVGAKNLATAEYKAFLKKVPDHTDKKKFEKYVKDNPPQ